MSILTMNCTFNYLFCSDGDMRGSHVFQWKFNLIPPNVSYNHTVKHKQTTFP